MLKSGSKQGVEPHTRVLTCSRSISMPYTRPSVPSTGTGLPPLTSWKQARGRTTSQTMLGGTGSWEWAAASCGRNAWPAGAARAERQQGAGASELALRFMMAPGPQTHPSNPSSAIKKTMAHLIKRVAQRVGGVCRNHQRGAPRLRQSDRQAGAAARLPHAALAAQHEVLSSLPRSQLVYGAAPQGAAKVV